MGTSVEDRNAILATMGISEDDPNRTEVLNDLGLAEDEDELRWFYQNDPVTLFNLGLISAEEFDQEIENEEQTNQPPTWSYFVAGFMVILWVLYAFVD